jgi:hypothetical protein
MEADVRVWQRRTAGFVVDAHKLFARYEGSATRVIELRQLAKRLQGLPVDVESYFREAVDCLEHGFHRSATVMSWAGFFSVFMDAMYAKHEADIRSARNKWTFTDVTELKESQPESALIEVAKVVGFIKQAERRKYDGQLSTRNQCAHPTLYKPTPNEAIGFVDLMVSQTTRYV